MIYKNILLEKLKWWQKTILWFKKSYIYVDYNHKTGFIAYVVFKRLGKVMIVVSDGYF